MLVSAFEKNEQRSVLHALFNDQAHATCADALEPY